jgi:hypothetical protein
VTINEHATHFAGRPIVDWEPDKNVTIETSGVYRITLDYDEHEAGGTWTDKLARFLEQPGVEGVRGIVVGPWGDVAPGDDSSHVVEGLVSARDRLPGLRALFLGDITFEECEMSWINQTDVSPVLEAYPDLEELRVRGGEGLAFGTLRHQRLRLLAIETGGLDGGIVRQVGQAELPALEHLELWLGSDNYGGTTTVGDLEPILAGERFPKLRYLGLRDAEIADQVAVAVGASPVLGRIKVLDLSLGNLSDEGALALASSPAVRGLEKLDIHHHYCSNEMVARLKALGIEVDAGDQQDEEANDGERYIAVSE